MGLAGILISRDGELGGGLSKGKDGQKETSSFHGVSFQEALSND